MIRLLQGDCREVLPTLDECSVDSVVCDPPYEIGFMGKAWDARGVAFDPETWRHALRVLKPGGHLLAFGGTRTYHRMVCAIEDAGFEVRDCIAWVYGSGFPKSLNVARAIHDAAIGQPQGGRKPGSVNHGKFKGGCSEENAAGRGFGAGPGAFMAEGGSVSGGRVLVPEATEWQGWGTALKPSHEPLVIAQKPYGDGIEWVTIGRLITGLWSDLWLMSDASDAERFSALSPSACGVDVSASARWTAERRSSTRAALCEAMGTSQFVMALASCLNTVRSWSGILAASSPAASTSTTATESRTTTDWRTLRFSLSRITPENIILAHRSGQWSSADACNAARCSSAIVAGLSATLELSAAGSAIASERAGSLGVGASPCHSHIVVARKPLSERNVAANVLRWGTGAINVDGCRVTTQGPRPLIESMAGAAVSAFGDGLNGSRAAGTTTAHRWPANLCHDGSDEVLAAFPEGSFNRPVIRGREAPSAGRVYGGGLGAAPPGSVRTAFGDSGSAARFFYTAKASRADRGEGNTHPTVKPTDLMRWLVRLVTPPGGTVLDPFAGSGSTLKAAELEGFDAIGIELLPEHVEIARRRIGSDAPLFAEVQA